MLAPDPPPRKQNGRRFRRPRPAAIGASAHGFYQQDARKAKEENGLGHPGHVATSPPGRQSPEAAAQYWAAVEQFAAVIRQIASGLDFKPSSRGWCYIFEGMHYLTKADFDACFRLINDCRKRGILPLDIACEDDKRQFENLEDLTDYRRKSSPRPTSAALPTCRKCTPRSAFGRTKHTISRC